MIILSIGLDRVFFDNFSFICKMKVKIFDYLYKNLLNYWEKKDNVYLYFVLKEEWKVFFNKK